MSIGERADKVLATYTGQTVGWVLILAVILGFFSLPGSDVTFLITVIALGMSWLLGASFGRRQVYDKIDQDEDTE